jgi:hypothetical protein
MVTATILVTRLVCLVSYTYMSSASLVASCKGALGDLIIAKIFLEWPTYGIYNTILSDGTIFLFKF